MGVEKDHPGLPTLAPENECVCVWGEYHKRNRNVGQANNKTSSLEKASSHQESEEKVEHV